MTQLHTIAMETAAISIKCSGSTTEEVQEKLSLLSDIEMQSLLDVVAAAGFEPESAAIGKLYYPGHENKTEHLINEICPFKIIGKNSHDTIWGTGWLDCLFLLLSSENDKSEASLAQVIQYQIERARPLQPIRITSHGDGLTEKQPGRPIDDRYPAFLDHTRDTDVLKCDGSHIGNHSNHGCGGIIEAQYRTDTEVVCSCRKCFLRIHFPKTVKTYGDLRSHFSNLEKS